MATTGSSMKPVWKRALNKAVNDNGKPAATWFQLATVDQRSLQPKNRTVVFRGWLSELAEAGKAGTSVCFTSDSRAAKASEAGPCEICWCASAKCAHNACLQIKLLHDIFLPSFRFLHGYP